MGGLYSNKTLFALAKGALSFGPSFRTWSKSLRDSLCGRVEKYCLETEGIADGLQGDDSDLESLLLILPSENSIDGRGVVGVWR